MTSVSVATQSGRPSQWADAVLAAQLFAIDPSGVGGILVRSAAGPVRDQWMQSLRRCLPVDTPFQTAPLHISLDRLLGGLDLAATLASGKRAMEPGVLTRADGGVVVLSMCERWPVALAAQVACAMDRGVVQLARDGLSASQPACFGIVALDEGLPDEPRPPTALCDRIALQIDLDAIEPREAGKFSVPSEQMAKARRVFTGMEAPKSAVVEALCAAAAALGITSLRAPLAALRVAQLHAALAGRTTVADDDAVVAARLVLAPRAEVLPQVPSEIAETPENKQPQHDTTLGSEAEAQQSQRLEGKLEDLVIAAAAAAIPKDILRALQGSRPRAANSAQQDGRSGQSRHSASRGRAIGVRAADRTQSSKLNLLATLRAAAPWQKLRASAQPENPNARSGNATLVRVRPRDFRVTRYKHQSGSTVVFAVDASGSSALHRLAEAKGAVELLLSECYARRDRVALVAFRGTGAESLLEPSRSLARAKRCLAALPGGGGTPLAAGLDAAFEIAATARRKGDTPLIVLMTDGRANVTRAGGAGRGLAQDEAVAAARQLRSADVAAVLVDTSPQPSAFARALAAEMGAQYRPLPHADAAVIARTIQQERLQATR